MKIFYVLLAFVSLSSLSLSIVSAQSKEIEPREPVIRNTDGVAISAKAEVEKVDKAPVDKAGTDHPMSKDPKDPPEKKDPVFDLKVKMPFGCDLSVKISC